MNTLKDHFGGLKEEVSLLQQDLQKIQERTTMVENLVSNIEDQLPPLARGTQSAYQLAKDANNRA